MYKLFSCIVLGLVVLVPVAENAPTEFTVLYDCFDNIATIYELDCCPKIVFDFIDTPETETIRTCEKQNVTDCDKTICDFNALGILEDGVVNKDKAVRVLTLANDKPVGKEMSERVQRFCFGDTSYITQYLDDEECNAMQFAMCSGVNSFIACLDTSIWKQTEKCNKYSSKLKKCAKNFEEDIAYAAGLKEKEN